jgi:hypothetical protein
MAMTRNKLYIISISLGLGLSDLSAYEFVQGSLRVFPMFGGDSLGLVKQNYFKKQCFSSSFLLT